MMAGIVFVVVYTAAIALLRPYMIQVDLQAIHKVLQMHYLF